MLGLLATATVCGYLAFAFVSECMNPFAVPSSHVARRRYRRGRFAGLYAATVIVALLAWLLVGGTPGATISVVAGGLATVAIAAVSLYKLLRIMGKSHPDTDSSQSAMVNTSEIHSSVQARRVTAASVDIELEPEPVRTNRRAKKRSARPV